MNIIEPIWVALQCALQKRSPPPGTLMDLRTALQDSWCGKPSGYFQTLVDTLPRRVAALLCFSSHLIYQIYSEKKRMKTNKNSLTGRQSKNYNRFFSLKLGKLALKRLRMLLSFCFCLHIKGNLM
ncbi:hypothetical protein AVEN_222016-1 [Araneus ventricosus]|uniref:Uncharacterized protein n=1 Tax=Araneus ventricosus TaxID=182803 RepID=A0A4Y2GT88_ARAVE|nr:hypothetical protein AVEN_24449-1 [Araneus ventricosus]GBM55677.1 hypothetical protein AVEN_152040-1 [Araneus ventricosus]GBM55708.1 hypothetical protein AVEN_219697-1 [Araneus ventricosus]GBM55713.1 hypothetical protein AVEN_222016-1 [Araneus ventricosus]